MQKSEESQKPLTLQEELKKYERKNDCSYCGEARRDFFVEENPFVCWACIITVRNYGD